LVTLPKAACLVDTDIARTIFLQRTNAVFGIGKHIRAAQRVAALFASIALVTTNKNVMLEITHENLLGKE
jgi:hypothetical protein